MTKFGGPGKWLAVLVVASAAVEAQSQRPSFKAGVQLVRIDVSVLDANRQPVRGLQGSDFTVLEDGQPRPIRAFQAVDLTAVPAFGATASVQTTSGVVSNQASGDGSRLIFILMDRSIPPERPVIIARQIADAAVDAMAPGDLAAIVTTGAGVPQNLTSDRARLHKTIAGSDWSHRLSEAQLDDPIIKMSGLGDPKTDGACLCGLCAMDTIAQIANHVRDVPRRKLLLFIGSDIIVQGGPRAPSADIGCEMRLRESRERLFAALETSGLTVHSIDPQGLASVGPATRATVANGIENRTPADLSRQRNQEQNDFMNRQGNLAVLPELTGGRTILDRNEPFRVVPDVLHESDAYYLLAFEPIESTVEVRHKVDVKVARKGVQVHSVRYIDPFKARVDPAIGTPPSPVERALTGLLPDGSLPLGMSVSTFAGPDRRHAYIGITLDASAFASGGGSIPLEIAVQASDERGRPVAAARQNGTVQVPTTARMSALVELQTYLTLPPGDYELRSAVMNPKTQAASSVFTHITVPAYDANTLVLSDVVFGTLENAGLLPDGAPQLPIVPTTARVFTAGQTVSAFVRAYRPPDAGPERQPAPVSIDVSLLGSNGKRVKHQRLPEASFAGRAADVRLPLPLKGLASGRYVLQIDAKQGGAQVSRCVAFEVAQAQPTLTQEHSPELDAVLAASARYLDEYEHRIIATGAEEEYEQGVSSGGSTLVTGDTGMRVNARNGILMTVPTTTLTRKTRANVMTISLGARGWISFRDVFEIDGRPVRDRAERLSRVLRDVNRDSLQQAREIADESARYNLDPQGARIDRTINVPMTALYFLRAGDQSRSVFTLGKPERVGGVMCTTLQFVEQARPRLIRTDDGAPAKGTFWIDMANGGTIVKTELRMESAVGPGQVVRARSAVTYSHVKKLDLWLPVEMSETYELTATRQTVTGHATYSDFREFKVTTSEEVK